MEIGFLPRRISSKPFQFCPVLAIMQDITTCMYMYTYVHVHWYIQDKVLIEEVNTQSGTVGFAPEKHNELQLFR